MKRLLKNIAWDAILTWPLIYFGLFLHVSYAYNLAVAFFWMVSIAHLLIAACVLGSDEFLSKARIKRTPPLWLHRKYQAISSAAEIAIMFAFGYFWLGGFYLVATIFMWAAKSKIEEELK